MAMISCSGARNEVIKLKAKNRSEPYIQAMEINMHQLPEAVTAS